MPEQIGVFLLFIAFVVLNLIAGAVNRRRQRAAAEKGKQLPPPRAPVPLTVPPPRVFVRPPSIEEAAPPPPVVVRRPATRGRVRVHGSPRLELRRDQLRRAIVLMTVLGPPRALEHEAKEGGGGR